MNWKTTVAGIGAALTAVGAIVTGIASGDFSVLASNVPALIAGLGLLFAKDWNVTGGNARQQV